MATASQFNRPYAEMPLMAGENSTLLRGAGNGLANRAAVPVGGGMTPQRRLDMLSRRAWTQGDMGTVQDLAQSKIYREMWQQPRGGMPGMQRAPLPGMQRPMMAPPPPSLPAMPAPALSAPTPPTAPPMDSTAPMAPLPIGGTDALQPSMRPSGPPMFALPPSRPGDLPPNPLTTPMPGISTQPPAQPPFFSQDVNGWNVLGANTPEGPKFMNARPPQPAAEATPPPFVPTPEQVRQHNLQPDFTKTVVHNGQHYPTWKAVAPKEQTVKALNAKGEIVDVPAGYELPPGYSELKPKGAAAAPAAANTPVGTSGQAPGGWKWNLKPATAEATQTGQMPTATYANNLTPEQSLAAAREHYATTGDDSQLVQHFKDFPSQAVQSSQRENVIWDQIGQQLNTAAPDQVPDNRLAYEQARRANAQYLAARTNTPMPVGWAEDPGHLPPLAQAPPMPPEKPFLTKVALGAQAMGEDSLRAARRFQNFARNHPLLTFRQ